MFKNVNLMSLMLFLTLFSQGFATQEDNFLCSGGTSAFICSSGSSKTFTLSILGFDTSNDGLYTEQIFPLKKIGGIWHFLSRNKDTILSTQVDFGLKNTEYWKCEISNTPNQYSCSEAIPSELKKVAFCLGIGANICRVYSFPRWVIPPPPPRPVTCTYWVGGGISIIGDFIDALPNDFLFKYVVENGRLNILDVNSSSILSIRLEIENLSLYDNYWYSISFRAGIIESDFVMRPL
jgi:hypothetical protein